MTPPSSKTITLLIASLVLNAFLLGVGVTHWVGHRKDRGARPVPHEPRVHSQRPRMPGPPPGHPDKPGGFQRDNEFPPPGASGERSWAPGRRRGEGPSAGERHADRPAHARLLRQLVRAMGGPQDPRAQKMLSQSRETMKSTRRNIAAAQDAVERALVASPYDPAALERALAELNRQSNVAQEHAQSLLVQLANQLTLEERARVQIPTLGPRGVGSPSSPKP